MRRGTMKTKTRDQDEVGWSLMLRRYGDASVQGQRQGAAERYELICRVCGDDSSLTYLIVSPFDLWVAASGVSSAVR